MTGIAVCPVFSSTFFEASSFSCTFMSSNSTPFAVNQSFAILQNGHQGAEYTFTSIPSLLPAYCSCWTNINCTLHILFAIPLWIKNFGLSLIIYPENFWAKCHTTSAAYAFFLIYCRNFCQIITSLYSVYASSISFIIVAFSTRRD